MLGFVDDEEGYFLDASQRASFAGAEEDTAAVAEPDLFLAGGKTDAVVGVYEAVHFRSEHDGAQAFEGVFDDAEVLGRPYDAGAGGSGGAVDRDPADVVGLAGLARDRQDGVACRPEAVGAFGEHDPVDLPLPRVETVAGRVGELVEAWFAAGVQLVGDDLAGRPVNPSAHSIVRPPRPRPAWPDRARSTPCRSLRSRR